VYFTFASRGEDCLALGAIADGVFGDYHYRHPRYAPYMRLAPPSLEGGLRLNALENVMQPLVTAILSSHIPPGLLPALAEPVGPWVETKGQGKTGGCDGPSLLECWLANELVEWEPSGGVQLTANGAWFAGNLVNDLARHVAHGFLA
jgi:hypothetical protein